MLPRHRCYFPPIGQFGKIQSPISTVPTSRLQPKAASNKHKNTKLRRGATELTSNLNNIKQPNNQNRYTLGAKVAKIGGHWIHRGLDCHLGNIILIKTIKMNNNSKKQYNINEYNKYAELLYKQRKLIKPKCNKYSSKVKLVCQWKHKNIIYKVYDFHDFDGRNNDKICQNDRMDKCKYKCERKSKGEKNVKKRRGAVSSTILSMTLPVKYDECEIGI